VSFGPNLGDFGIIEFTANRTQRRKRALFVLAHQPRIAGYINLQNPNRRSTRPSLTSPASPQGARRRRLARLVDVPVF
jgi:hypothetical protein